SEYLIGFVIEVSIVTPVDPFPVVPALRTADAATLETHRLRDGYV
ncbi:uncharacterized, partial [Tachysurus ichikawai]